MRAVRGSLLALWLLAAFAPVRAAEPPALEDVAETLPIHDMETLVVHGSQPGPGLWKVSKGEHVLWILGTVAPLPNGIQWQAGEVEEIIAGSQQVLSSPSLVFDADVGFFGMLALAPSVWKVMRNEEGAKLEDVLPPPLHARWRVQKQRYLGRDAGIERKRPMIAANELYAAAIKSAGLGQTPVVRPVLERATKAAGIKPVSTSLRLKVDDPKAAIREFRSGGFDDTACFERKLALVEHDLPTLVARANAWAVGDIEALRRLPHEDADGACLQAVAESGFARNRGYTDLREQVLQQWLSLAEKALATNTQTFALLPIDGLLAEDGYLARLQARGYEVEAP